MTGDIDVVMIRSAMVENVGGSRWNYVCVFLETEVTSINRKSSIFPRRVLLVFQVVPCAGKSYVHAENAETSRIAPSSYSYRPSMSASSPSHANFAFERQKLKSYLGYRST